MVLFTEHLSCSRRKVMPALKHQSSFPSEDEIEEVEDLAFSSQFTFKGSLQDSEKLDNGDKVNTSEDYYLIDGFDNGAYESDEYTSDETLTKHIQTLEFEDLKYIDDFNDSTMSIRDKSNTTQTLSLSQDNEWMEAERNAFIANKIQGIVRGFQYRTEKAMEKLVQPPTPSPSPPLETSSENDPDTPAQSRPRLHSLIEDETSSNTWSPNNSGCCFTIKKKFLQTFPRIIDPQSKLYIIWLFFVMASYAYNAWSIVLRAVFPYQTTENLPIFLMFDYMSDVIYLLDIIVFKVRLQFLHNGFWVEDYKLTKANYFRKRDFKLDVLSLLPLDLLYFVYGINPLFRFPRFFKVQTFWEFFHRVDAVTKTPYVIRIIRTLMYMMYLIHLNACAYYAMSIWEGIGSNKWVFQGIGNAYIRCFYFATKTATSIGKNPKPENEVEYIFMTISWLMGVFIFAFLVGQIRDIVATATMSRTQYRQLMDQTVMYMRNLNLPDELQRRVRMWLNHNWEQQKTFDVSSILDTLPRKMKTDVAINVHYKTLVKVQLFKDCDKALLRDLVLQLKPVLFLPGDYICRKGEVGKEMYIVNKGIVEVLGGERGDVLATLTKGSVFGEISLLGIVGCNRRTADVRSKGFSNLFVLSKDDLWEALKNYPEAQKKLKKKAKNIIKENETRMKANQPLDEVSPEVSLKQEDPPPFTPKLVKTVMQMLPKPCSKIKPPSSTSFIIPIKKSSFSSSSQCNTNASILHGENKEQTSEQIPLSSKLVHLFRNRKIGSAPIVQKSNDLQQPRSFSDDVLRKLSAALEHSNKIERTSEIPMVVKKISPTKSEPCYYHNLQESSSHGSINSSCFPSLVDRIRFSRSLVTGCSEDTEIYESNLSADEKYNKETEEYERTQNPGTLESSSISSTSSQKMIIDLTDEEDISRSTSSSSIIPYIGHLFNKESKISSNSSEDKGQSGIIDNSTSSTSNKNHGSTRPQDNTPPSNASSLLYLGGLFHCSSNQSFNSSTTKDIPQSQILKNEPDDSSSTTSSSMTGYDNLGFAPVDIFSRRSSIFSDASG